MVRDRLLELNANRRTDCRFGKSFLQDVCTQKVPSKKVKDALDEAETCRGMLNILKDNITIVKDLHNNALSHTDPGIQAQLESRTFIISQTAFRTRTSLKELGNKIPRVDELTLDSTRDGPAHARIRFLQYTTMTKIFSDIMYEYNESLTRYHEKCSSLLHQQKILLRKETASQIFQSNDDDDDDGEEKQQLFVDNILEESKLARLQLSDIETRHKEVLKIEKSLVEVRDMLTDIAFYIEKQGEQLDYVEVFAGQATDNIEGGRDDLARAEIRRNRNRKRKYKLYIILVVIVALIVVVLAVSL